jgi:hypothetical protein
MKFDITLNGVSVTKEIPTSWDQVTFRQLLDLTETDELKALSTFTGIDGETLRKAQITGLADLLTALSFIQRPVAPAMICKEIHTKEQTFAVPLDLGFESFGQYIDIKEALDELEKIIDKEKKGMETLKLFPKLCAIYTVKPYDFKAAEERIEDFFNAPCTEVMAVGNFILMKLIALRSTIESNYQKQAATRMQKFRLALKAWWINTAFTVRYFIWKKRHRLTVTK